MRPIRSVSCPLSKIFGDEERVRQEDVVLVESTEVYHASYRLKKSKHSKSKRSRMADRIASSANTTEGG